MSSVIDGTSNTAVFSELGIVKDNKVGTDTLPLKRHIAMNSTHGDPDASTGCPRGCLSRRGKNNIVTGVADSGGTGTLNTWCGRGFHDGLVGATGFNTILPPNSPSCSTSADFTKFSNLNLIISANSFHSGGVNLALVDGSVRFVSDTVDCETVPGNTALKGLDQKPVTSGASPYGIWGAYGSRNGGETSSL